METTELTPPPPAPPFNNEIGFVFSSETPRREHAQSFHLLL